MDGASRTPPTPLAPHVAALTRCFSTAPPSAAAAIVDCVVASAALSPPLLFSSLLLAFPDPAEALRSNCALSYTAALCHLVDKTQFPIDTMQLLIWRVFLPLLREINSNDFELLNQIVGLLCNVVSKNESWDVLGATLVPFCHWSISLDVGLLQHDETVVYTWNDKEYGGKDASWVLLGPLSLLMAARISTSLLGFALRELKSFEELTANRFSSLNILVQNLTWDLSKLAIEMLTLSPDYRSCAIRMLLPAILSSLDARSHITVSVRGMQYTISRVGFLKDIWKCCISLFSSGNLEQLDACNVLSLYFSSFSYGVFIEPKGDKSEDFDARDQKEFWDEMRRGLVDKDSSLRKQALYVLKISLGHYSSSPDGFNGVPESLSCSKIDSYSACSQASLHASLTKRERWANKEAKSLGVEEVCQISESCLSSQDRWRAFLLLYEMLEEYGTHLVEAAWYHQVKLLLQSIPQNDWPNAASHLVYHAQMETLEGIFCWISVLWERGFSHENPQVRCLIMQSFLDIGWEKHKDCAKNVPKDFVLGPLVRGLNDVVHHKDFGVGGVYNSKTVEGAAKFFREFSHQMILSDRFLLVWRLASAARQESFGRAGLMTLACCIASCACHSDTYDGHCEKPSLEPKTNCSCDNFSPINAADLLDVLGIVIERSKQHFNPNYRLKVCEQMLKAASYFIKATEIPLNLLLPFISTVPREFTDYNGSLREIVQKWLMHSSDSFPVETNSSVLTELIQFPVNFIKHIYPIESVYIFDDDDVGAWETEARRWARVLLLVISEEDHIEPILMFLCNYGSSLSVEYYLSKWIPIKFLVIILSLVEEFQMGQSKFIYHSDARSEAESNQRRSDNSFPFLTSYGEKLTGALLSILNHFLAFAKSACLVFSAAPNSKETDLPCSVKGKLGGPCQRRLASFMTPLVLQAILSVRSVSCVLSLCNHSRNDPAVKSSFSFLGDFTWRVIQSSTYDTETGAEFCLAAYEALTYVFRALSTAFTSSSPDFLITYNKLWQLKGEFEPSLDLLVNNLLDNINNLLANGILTRSRRAVLMCWKWLCVESLLLIPYNVSEGQADLRSSNPFFSVSTLRAVFQDIVESLENAGESYVLSILRCVRLVLGLFCSDQTYKATFSASLVDRQMILQLVKSSWILHLSCNKRRVAPIAALLSAILHPTIFNDLNLHETNGSEQGPLKWFIEKLLDEGVKSPRTIRLAALHLTGLWMMYPRTVKYYINELKKLSLYGSVAFDEDFEAELSENLEAKAEVSLLAQSPDCEFTEVFINTELYARVSVAVLFNYFGNLEVQGSLQADDAFAAVHCGKLFLLELLDSAVNDKDLAKELYKKYSSVHRRKVRAWQMICILWHFIEDDIVEKVTSNLHLCLYRNNLPAVRQYLETFAIQLYLKFPTLAEEQLIPIFHDYNMRPQALSSYVFIAANVIIHSSELPVQIKHLNELFPPIVPFLTSHHHSLRGFTQLLVHFVLSKLWIMLELGNSEVVFLKKCFEDLKIYLTENTDCARLRASMEGFLDVFDPNTSTTPAGVFRPRTEGSDFECVPISLMERVIEFLNVVRDDLRFSVAKDSMNIKNESIALSDGCNGNLGTTNADTGEPVQTRKDVSLDFQKKITLKKDTRQPLNSDAPHILGSTDFSNSLSEIEKEDLLVNSVLLSRNQAIERIRQTQQQFILVASLVERIPNLAGLARTCEVFKAASLAIADASILQDKQFQLISVTAEKWLPILEVPTSSIKVFLEKKRNEGYSVIGLEQTANSTPLDQFSFPNKTVLVLGREKEGIPVDIIHTLDACVEIPQIGIIRSLNVHVSGAIALWEYTRQRRCGQP